MNSIQLNKFFPLSSRYNQQWVRSNSLGENVLFNLESLCEVIDIYPGMRILDLGSGKAVSAIFLAKEFNASVWAVDANANPTDNLRRVREMGCEKNVVPLKLDARQLPFPKEYFDAIIAADSFMYYGTDFGYTNYITDFLKPGGQIGIVDVCRMKKNITPFNPETDLVKKDGLDFVNSLDWWHNLWSNTGILEVKVSQIIPETELIKEEYIRDCKYSNKKDILAEELAKDVDNDLKIFRMVAEKIKTVKTDIYDYYKFA